MVFLKDFYIAYSLKSFLKGHILTFLKGHTQTSMRGLCDLDLLQINLMGKLGKLIFKMKHTCIL
jgi:hypothetical protein